MDGAKFDTWTKTLTGRSSRRFALGRLAGGGITAALLGGLGLSRAPVAAQSAATPVTPTGASLTGNFQAKIYEGPDHGRVFTGRLQLTGDSSGRLSGQLRPATGPAIPVTGQLTGFAINLVFYLPGEAPLFGVGSIGQDPTTQRWVVGGPLVGPKPGDGGDWDFCLMCHFVSGSLVCAEIKCPGSALA